MMTSFYHGSERILRPSSLICARRLTVYKVPLDRATFRNETTGGEIKAPTRDVPRKGGAYHQTRRIANELLVEI
jgi:hypothetical protein